MQLYYYLNAMRFQILVTAFCFIECLFAQKYDNTWVIGHDYNFNDAENGRLVINFHTNPPTVEHLIGDIIMNMYVANASISDSAGQLLFYTNGCDIANADDEYLPNGGNINEGIWHDKLCDQNRTGYATGYPGIMVLPKPDSPDVYYIFHQSMKYGSSPVEYAFVNKVSYTVVRKRDDDNEPYWVEEKNVQILEDSLSAGEMHAVKHANGKDWWIIFARRNSNQFYFLRFTKDGIAEIQTQTIGDFPPVDKESLGQTTFSPNGLTMIRYFPYNSIMKYSFDRNIGTFTNFNIVSIAYDNMLQKLDGGCSFSPSSRYLYVAAVTKIFQFDLYASDVSTTQTTVAIWDGFVDPIAILFWHCQLGPDCKIYIIGGGDTRYYHIIHNPDEPGLACNVEQRGLVFPIPSGASIPYFPNYRLGPIDNPGLPCSPVVATSQPVLPAPGIGAWPNPAHSQVSFGPLPAGARSLRLYDVFGRVAKETALSGGSEVYTLSVADLAAGVYFWEVAGAGGIRAGRVVVEK